MRKNTFASPLARALLLSVLSAPPLGVVIIICLAFSVRFKFKEFNKLGWGILLLFIVFLISFYTKSHVVGEFDRGGTWVADRSIGTALESFFLLSTSFMAALFGYNSNGTYGPNNSDNLYLLGALFSGAILVGGQLLAQKYLPSLKRLLKTVKT